MTLGIFEPTSPCDPTGTWFVAALVDEAERAKRAKIEEAHRRRHGARDAEMVAEGRAISARWAVARGFASIDAYVEAEGIDWSEALKRVCHSIAAAGAKQMPRGANAKWRGSAADMGVTAKEVFAPTLDEMAAGRRALGLESGHDG